MSRKTITAVAVAFLAASIVPASAGGLLGSVTSTVSSVVSSTVGDGGSFSGDASGSYSYSDNSGSGSFSASANGDGYSANVDGNAYLNGGHGLRGTVGNLLGAVNTDDLQALGLPNVGDVVANGNVTGDVVGALGVTGNGSGTLGLGDVGNLASVGNVGGLDLSGVDLSGLDLNGVGNLGATDDGLEGNGDVVANADLGAANLQVTAHGHGQVRKPVVGNDLLGGMQLDQSLIDGLDIQGL